MLKPANSGHHVAFKCQSVSKVHLANLMLDSSSLASREGPLSYCQEVARVQNGSLEDSAAKGNCLDSFHLWLLTYVQYCSCTRS